MKKVFKKRVKEKNPISIKISKAVCFIIVSFYIFDFKKDYINKEQKFMILKEGKKFIEQCLNFDKKNYRYKNDIKPDISVIIPVYNSQKTIYSSICSIQNQNYTNFEIVLIDDFSTDNTSSVYFSLQEKDSRIIIIKNKKNMGSLYSRSIGVLFSQGMLIFPLDNDDLFFCKNILDYFKRIEEKYNFDIIGFRAFQIDNYNDGIEKIRDLYKYQYYPEKITVYQPELSIWMITVNGKYHPHDVTIWCKCIKSNIYKEATLKLGIKRYSNFVSWGEDAIANFAIFNLAKSFTFIHKYGIIHFHNKITASYSISNDIKLFGEIFFVDIIYDFSLKECLKLKNILMALIIII